MRTRRSPWSTSRGGYWSAGSGLGFTLDRVLGDRRVEHVDVVEIEPALVEWMRDGTIPHGPRLLADSRARVVVADIARAVTEAAPATYDVVLLDVDNGPGQLVHQANAALYDEPFLRAVRDRLNAGGALRRLVRRRVRRRSPTTSELGLRRRRGARPRRPPPGPRRALLALRRAATADRRPR